MHEQMEVTNGRTGRETERAKATSERRWRKRFAARLRSMSHKTGKMFRKITSTHIYIYIYQTNLEFREPMTEEVERKGKECRPYWRARQRKATSKLSYHRCYQYATINSTNKFQCCVREELKLKWKRSGCIQNPYWSSINQSDQCNEHRSEYEKCESDRDWVRGLNILCTSGRRGTMRARDDWVNVGTMYGRAE